MTCLLDRFLDRSAFASYEDFYNDMTIRVPENFNFAFDVVDVYAEEQPEKRAMVWLDDKGETQIFSFRRLREEVDKTANLLVSLGVRKGDPIMLTLKGRYEFWYCLLALHKIGAVAIPATHMLMPKDIVYRVRKADIKMIISIDEDELPSRVEAAREETGDTLKTLVLVSKQPRSGWVDFNAEQAKAKNVFLRPAGDDATRNEDPCLIYFSSGTTGLPKMVLHNFAYPLGHIITAKYWQNVMDDGLHYTVADSGWAKSAWGKLYGQWIAGSAVFVYDYDKFNAANMLRKSAEHRVTTFCAPPTIYRFLIKEDLSQYDFSSLKYAVVAGEPLNPEVYERFHQLTGLKLMEGYGQTELVVTVATFPWMEPKPGSMGRPSPGYRIALLNPEGGRCEAGEEGEIVIDTSKGNPPGMFDGYYRDEETTRCAWRDGYYHTGDTAWMDEDGYLWFVGRADDMIKSSGYRIGPFEVESALIEHPAVLECAVTGAPDPDRGQVVKATVVLAKGYEASEELKKTLQEHVKSVTAPYKYPRVIEFVKELPKTISGKIRRVEIRERDGDDQVN